MGLAAAQVDHLLVAGIADRREGLPLAGSSSTCSARR